MLTKAKKNTTLRRAAGNLKSARSKLDDPMIERLSASQIGEIQRKLTTVRDSLDLISAELAAELSRRDAQ